MHAAFYFDSSGWFPTLVRWIAGRPIHVAILRSDGTLFETQGGHGGVVGLTRYASLKLGMNDWFLIAIPDADESKLQAIVAAETGCGYDYFGVLLGWTLGLRTKDRWFCSELAAYCLQQCGMTLHHANPARYTPRRLYTELLARYGMHEAPWPSTVVSLPLPPIPSAHA